MLDDHVFDKDSSSIIRGSSLPDCDTMFVRCKQDIHLLVRIVDDFLLISTSKQTSVRFLSRLNKGISPHKQYLWGFAWHQLADVVLAYALFV